MHTHAFLILKLSTLNFLHLSIPCVTSHNKGRLVKAMRNPLRSKVWQESGLKACDSISPTLVELIKCLNTFSQGPPKRMLALDLLGFGHSAKPSITYSQHLWEAQIVDFVHEVGGGRPFVLAGNSIGGGLSAGVAANLAHLCRGLILCNTAVCTRRCFDITLSRVDRDPQS